MRVLTREQQFRVVGSHVLRNPGCVSGLVELFLGEPDRVRLDGSVARLLHHRHDPRGIDSPGQERAERDVRKHPTPDRVRQQRVELVDCLGIRAMEGARYTAQRSLSQRPVRLRSRQREARVRNGEDVCGGQLDGMLEDGLRRRDIEVSEIGRQRHAVDRAVEGGPGEERLELRAERDQARLAVHIKRLLADAVSDERQLPALGIPHGDREHSDEAADGGANSPSFKRGEDDLGVRVPPKAVSVLLQLAAKVSEVVDLSVEDRHETTGRRPHRLMAMWRQVDDGEPTKSEGQPRLRVRPDSAVVRSPVHDRRDHAPRVVRELVGCEPGGCQDTGETAHFVGSRIRARGDASPTGSRLLRNRSSAPRACEPRC